MTPHDLLQRVRRRIGGTAEASRFDRDQLRAPFEDRATEADIFHAFRLLLGRHPNGEEVAGHMLQAGRPLADVARVYLGSREFAARGLMAADQGEILRVESPAGFTILVRPDDIAVGEAVAHGGLHEPHVTAAFERRLRPGLRVIDIGANIGWFTLLAAARVGREGDVIAVEPDRDNVRLLEASRRANGFDHVLLLPVAAGARSGAVAIYKAYSNAATAPLDTVDPLVTDIVPAIRLDDVIDAARGPVGLIKADVEGAEPIALAGLERLITRDHPVLISEFAPGMMEGASGIRAPDYLAWLASRGYRIGFIAPDGAEISCHDAQAVMDAHQKSGVDHIDLVCVPG